MAKSKSLHFSVGFGDWAREGHGKLDIHSIEIYSTDGSELKPKQIRKNYLANVAKLGFGLPELWEDEGIFNPSFEETVEIQTQLSAIYYGSEENIRGAADYALELKDEAHLIAGEGLPADSFRIRIDEEDGEVSFEDTDPKIPEELRLAMFIVLAGLPQVAWRRVSPPVALFGLEGSMLTGDSNVGYGRIF